MNSILTVTSVVAIGMNTDLGLRHFVRMSVILFFMAICVPSAQGFALSTSIFGKGQPGSHVSILSCAGLQSGRRMAHVHLSAQNGKEPGPSRGGWTYDHLRARSSRSHTVLTAKRSGGKENKKNRSSGGGGGFGGGLGFGYGQKGNAAENFLNEGGSGVDVTELMRKLEAGEDVEDLLKSLGANIEVNGVHTTHLPKTIVSAYHLLIANDSGI